MSHLVSAFNNLQLPASGRSPYLSKEDMDQQRLRQRKAQILPWIANPLHLFLHHESNSSEDPGHHLPVPTDQESEDQELELKLPRRSDTTLTRDDIIYEEVEAEEAHPLELFYDLFFVANLTTITSVHYMTDYESIVSYILFFVILWFTWLQTTFYDIRFTNDSFYERVVRSIHFAVMISFASVSTNWNPLQPSSPKARDNMMSMTLTLMASRMALGVQYGVACLYSFWHFKKGILPLMIHTLTMLVAGGLYLALYFLYQKNPSPKKYVVWYPIIAFELFAVLASSMYWKVVSFRRTHLVERLGLLTLIVIGEGIIVMLKAVNAVEKTTGYGRGWDMSMFFAVACAVGILYMLYMFYFDYTPRNVHYGTIRQQLWAVLHFPFHLAIVLSVEGLRQLATWWSFHQAYRNVLDQIAEAGNSSADYQESWVAFINKLEEIVTYLYYDGTAKTILKKYNDMVDALGILREINYDDPSEEAYLSLYQIQYDLMSGFAEWYGIKVPKTKGDKLTVEEIVGAGLDPKDFDPEGQILKVYSLVYSYFFSALAIVFLMYGILGLLVRRKKDGWDYFSVGWRFAIGITFFGLERLKMNPDLYSNFMNSPWPIPVVSWIMLIGLFVDKFVGLAAYKKMRDSMRL